MLALGLTPPAIAGARNSAAPIQDRPIQTIGAWMCTSRRKLKGKSVVDRDAVEAGPIVIGVGHDGAGGDLHQQQGSDGDKILADTPLAGVSGRNVDSNGSIGASSGLLRKYS